MYSELNTSITFFFSIHRRGGWRDEVQLIFPTNIAKKLTDFYGPEMEGGLWATMNFYLHYK